MGSKYTPVEGRLGDSLAEKGGEGAGNAEAVGFSHVVVRSTSLR